MSEGSEHAAILIAVSYQALKSCLGGRSGHATHRLHGPNPLRRDFMLRRRLIICSKSISKDIKAFPLSRKKFLKAKCSRACKINSRGSTMSSSRIPRLLTGMKYGRRGSM